MSDDVPASVRASCYVRDDYRCRLCGVTNAFGYELHHITYRSHGGPHEEWNLVTLCSACHRRAHAHANTWQPLLLEVVKRSGVTALQLRRWAERRKT